MSEIKEKALSKMLEEMNQTHNGAEDAIHNWLCDQEDEELFKGILKDGRTIKGAMQHCMSEASQQRVGLSAMIEDDVVFTWVFRYFTDDSVPKHQNNARTSVATSEPIKPEATEEKPKKAKRTKKEVTPIDEVEQLSLLDFI